MLAYINASLDGITLDCLKEILWAGETPNSGGADLIDSQVEVSKFLFDVTIANLREVIANSKYTQLDENIAKEICLLANANHQDLRDTFYESRSETECIFKSISEKNCK